MASIGKATLTVTPKFDGLGKSVTSALAGVDTSAAGAAAGQQYGDAFDSMGSGILGAGALAGVLATLTDKAMSVISDSLSDAAARLDTINNFPRVMTALGYSTDDAQASIDKMSSHLTGLPTSLDSMASSVQGVAAVTGDLDLATDASLAFNDMMLASGSSTQTAASASEQFRQILAKGKPELQDWKSLTAAAPGQMNQLAEEMLGAGATADDLYAALGGGGAEATVSTEDLLQAMIKLDTEGGDGITSFEQQAKDASGGVQTSVENMGTSVTRGLADVLDSVGTDRIQAVCGGIGDAFETALDVVAGAVDKIMPFIDKIGGALEGMSSIAIPAIGSFAAFETAETLFEHFAKKISNSGTVLNPFKSQAQGISDAFLSLATNCDEGSRAQDNLLGVSEAFSGASGALLTGVMDLAVLGFSALAAYIYDSYQKMQDHKTATEGLRDAVDDSVAPTGDLAGAFDEMAGSEQTASDKAGDLRDRLDEARDNHVELVDTINERNDDLETNVGLLESYKDTISDYMNKEGLSIQQQGELEFAISQVNDACDTQYEVVDAANGVIADQNGIIQDNVDAIYDQIDAKEEELRQEALAEDYKDVYKQSFDDLQTLREAQENYNEALEFANREQDDFGSASQSTTDWLAQMQDALEEAQENYDADADALDRYSEAMGDATSGAGILQDALSLMGGEAADGSGEIETAAYVLQHCGSDVDDFSRKLADAGVSADVFRDMSVEDFERFADECGGDVDLMVDKLREYNAEPVVDKEGRVHLDDAELRDAEGNIWTWNGTEMVDQYGNVAVDGTQLTDSLGNVWTWNESTLVDQYGNAVVDNGVPAAQETVDQWDMSYLETLEGAALVDYREVDEGTAAVEEFNANPPEDQTAVVDADTSGVDEAEEANRRWKLLDWTPVKAIVEFVTRLFDYNAAGGIRLDAAGGIRLDAEGGIVEYATHGGIATQAVPLDIVGEAGAEAIVPLTNRRYAEPFARLIAEEVGSYASTPSTVNNYYVGDIKVEGADAAALADVLETSLRRYGRLARM